MAQQIGVHAVLVEDQISFSKPMLSNSQLPIIRLQGGLTPLTFTGTRPWMYTPIERYTDTRMHACASTHTHTIKYKIIFFKCQLRNRQMKWTDCSQKRKHKWLVSILKNPASVVSGEMQMKTALRYHLTLVKTAAITKSDSKVGLLFPLIVVTDVFVCTYMFLNTWVQSAVLYNEFERE